MNSECLSVVDQPGCLNSNDARPYRHFRCRRCAASNLICSRCDRGNNYCKLCSVIQSRARKKASQRRYRQTERGRETNRRWQQTRRTMQKISNFVGDHGSPNCSAKSSTSLSPTNSGLDEGGHIENQNLCRKQVVWKAQATELYCSFCSSECAPWRYTKLARKVRQQWLRRIYHGQTRARGDP